MNTLAAMQEALISDCNKVYVDKLVVEKYTRKIVFLSVIGYSNIINDINKKFTTNKDIFGLNIKYGIRATNNVDKKYKVVSKKKDINFTHSIIYLDDNFNLDEDNKEKYISFLYLNASESNCEEELNNALYEKLNKYSSIPILKEWIPYIKSELFYYENLELLDNYGIEDNLAVYKLDADKHLIASIVCNGLKAKNINIEGCNEESSLLNSCNDLNGYLNLFGESLAKKIQDKFNPKFIPGIDKYNHYTDVIDDYVYLNSDNELYEAQKTAIQSIVNNWMENNNTMLVGEMGCGKTLISACSVYVHSKMKDFTKGSTCLIMCPSLLISNWEKQIAEFIPNSKTYVVRSLKDLLDIENKLRDKYRIENTYVILSKEVAKLGYEKRPCAIWKESISKKSHNNKYKRDKGTFVCPDCGNPLFKTIKIDAPDPFNSRRMIKKQIEVPLSSTDFLTENNINHHCLNTIQVYNDVTKEYEEKICGCKLWTISSPCNLKSQTNKQWVKLGKNGWILENLIEDAINELSDKEKITIKEKNLLNELTKILDSISVDGNENPLNYINKTSHKYPVAKYIKERMSGVFDYLIADEIHQLSGEDSKQGQAFHHLVQSCKKVIGLTGTIINGYADSIYYTLYRLYPHLMKKDGFEYEEVNKFIKMYGVSSKEIKYKIDRYGNRKNIGSNSSLKEPGISPLVFTKFLLNNTIFISLEDMAEGLPAYKETLIPVSMDEDLYQGYMELKDKTSEYLSYKSEDKIAIMSQFANLLLRYQDSPHNDLKVINNRKDELVYTTKKLEKIKRNKDIELLKILEEKITNGEKVLIYYESVDVTDIGKYLKELLINESFSVHLLTTKDASAEKRSDFISGLLENNIDIIITNPALVEVGLNLIEFTTIIFYQTGYKLDTLRQASRRSWRLSQKNEVNVYFMYYEETAQETALELMSNKLAASQSLEGKIDSEGLKAMGNSRNMLMKIANDVCNNIKTTIDKSLFKSFDYMKNTSNKKRNHIYTDISEIAIDLNDDGKRKTLLDKVRKPKPKNKINNDILDNIIQYFIS